MTDATDASDTAETPISEPTPPASSGKQGPDTNHTVAPVESIESSSTPTRYPSARAVPTDDSPATPPVYWTTYVATIPTDHDTGSLSTVAGTCLWLSTTIAGDGYCWVDPTPDRARVVCTVPQHRSHGNHEALAWLLDDHIRRLYVIESETNLEAPRLRVYSFRDDDPDLFDRHHGPTASLRLCDKFDALVDRRSIPTYLVDEYELSVPIYIDAESGPIEPLESIPAPASAGPHHVCADPDPDVVYACTGDVVDGGAERYAFDVSADRPPETSVATDGGARK